jgi:hypothetical protein
MDDISTLFWIGSSENISLGIKHGFTTAEAVEAALKEWHEFMETLGNEWPSDRIKNWINSYYDRHIATLDAFIVKLEIQNRDERTKGVSYKDRKVISEKIEAGHRVVASMRKDAAEAKAKSYNVHQFVEPIDMPMVKEKGFEALLKRWYW